MMELPVSAITGSLKIGVQVVSTHKRPVLEVYYQVRNRIGPEEQYELPILGTSSPQIVKTRPQDIFVQFSLANIGSKRAENVVLNISGPLRRNPPRESFGDVFDQIIPQFPPGQQRHLFSFSQFDLDQYPKGGGKPIGVKQQSFTITVSYSSGPGIINWIMALPRRLCGKSQYETKFTFCPQMVVGDLPPAEHA